MCMCILKFTGHYSLTQLAQKFGACTVSAEWWSQGQRSAMRRAMKLGHHHNNLCCTVLGVNVTVCLTVGAFDQLPRVDPRGAHSGEPLTRAYRTIKLALLSTFMSPPSDPLHKQGTWGWPRWAPGMTSKLFEPTRGRPGSTKGSLTNAPYMSVVHFLYAAWYTRFQS